MSVLRKCGRLLRTHARIGTYCRGERITSTVHNQNFGGYIITPYQQILKNSLSQLNSFSTDNSEVISNADSSGISPNAAERTFFLLCSYIKAQTVRYRDIERIIEHHDNGKLELDQQSCLLLLRCCGNMLCNVTLEERRALTLRVWELIQNRGYPLSAEYYNTLLSIHAQNISTVDPEQFLSSMKATANEDTYQLLLNVAAEAGDYRCVEKVMGKMKELGYSANVRTFNAFVLAHSLKGDVPGAKDVIDMMHTALIKPTMETYAALSRGFAINGDIKSLQQVLDTNNFNEIQLMLIVKTLSISGNTAHIPVVLKYLPDTVNESEPVVVNTVLSLTYMGHAEDAFQILNCLPVSAPSVDMSIRFGDFFLKELVRAATPVAQILKITDALISSNKNPFALAKVAGAALHLRDESVALVLFEEMRKRGMEIKPHFYWPLFLNCSTHHGEGHVIKLTKHMVDSNVALDYETLCSYIIPNLNLQNPIVTLRKLQDCRIQIAEILTPLLSVLLIKGEMKAAIELCKTIKGKIDKDDILQPLIRGCITTKDMKTTVQLLAIISPDGEYTSQFLLQMFSNKNLVFKEKELITLSETLKHHKLQISSTAGEVLKQRLSKWNNDDKILSKIKEVVDIDLYSSGVQLSSQILHPREMNTEDLENHLIELKSKELNTRGVMRRLLQNHCRENNLQRVQELKREFEANGFEWTGGLRASLFNLYLKNDMRIEALNELQQLQEKHKQFQLDEYKVIDFAKILVENDNPESALKILKEYENIRGGPGVLRNCFQLLNAMASGRHPEYTGKLLDLLVAKGYCQRSNVLLGPTIRAHLVRDDITSAVEEFKRCVKVYKKTPLQQELICSLVRMADEPNSEDVQNQLQEVLKLVTKIHGQESTQSQFLMALAVTGKINQLYKLFKSGKITNHALTSTVTRLVEENKLRALNTILEATKGVPLINKAPIYDSLITVYYRLGDHKAATDLWEKMQSEVVKPTQHFRRSLISLLVSHNVPLPLDLKSDDINQQQATT